MEELPKTLVEALSPVFYDPLFLARNAKALYQKVKELGLKYSQTDVNRFYESQEVVQIFRPYAKTAEKAQQDSQGKATINHIITLDGPVSRFFMDTMFFNSFGFAIVNGIDLFSRYGFSKAFPWKRVKDEARSGISSHQGAIALKAFEAEAVRLGFSIGIVEHDEGSEFKSDFPAYCQQRSIENVTTDRFKKNNLSVIERFNGTIRRAVEKFVIIHGGIKMKDIPGLVNTYNMHHVHDTTGYTPSAVLSDKAIREDLQETYTKEKERIRAALTGRAANTLAEGDRVRVLIKKLNDKGFNKISPNWSTEIFKVIGAGKDGVYRVDNGKRYKENQLQKITGVVYRYERPEMPPRARQPRGRREEEETEEEEEEEEAPRLPFDDRATGYPEGAQEELLRIAQSGRKGRATRQKKPSKYTT